MKKDWWILIIILVIVLFVSFNNRVEINSFEDCIAAGHPAMESYPRQCNDGKNIWTEDIIIGGDIDEH